MLHLVSFSAAGQTGTIKGAKPKILDKKDSVERRPIAFGVKLGINYTFQQNPKVGYEFGVWHNLRINSIKFMKTGIRIGLEYSRENRLYALSPFNEISNSDVSYSSSQNLSSFFKIPANIYRAIALMGRAEILVGTGITEEFLIKNRDRDTRLITSKFNRFNTAVTFFVGCPLLKRKALIYLNYSKDLFRSLKNENIYNEAGEITGKQNSKRNLLSFSIIYSIHGGSLK